MSADPSHNRHFTPLYYKDPKGRLRVWHVWTEGDKIITQYGLVDGQKQTSEKRATAKNVGKANMTTNEEQAFLEARSMWSHKYTRQYALSPEDAREIPVVLPMKLHRFDKQAKKIKYPAYIQPKLDGFRIMAMIDDDNEVVFLSRSGRRYEIPHLKDAVEETLRDVPSIILDGELYVHEEITFEKLSSLARRNRKESEILEFHVFDTASQLSNWDPGFNHRYELANELVGEIDHPNVVLVETLAVHSKEEAIAFHDQYIREGYEGAVVRNSEGKYRFNYRTYDALKIKQFMDEEFEIVNYTSGVGKFENAVIWICMTEDGKQFKATPMGTMQKRAEMLANAKKYIGKKTTVRFLNWTDDGIPRHPIATRIRGEE